MKRLVKSKRRPQKENINSYFRRTASQRGVERSSVIPYTNSNGEQRMVGTLVYTDGTVTFVVAQATGKRWKQLGELGITHKPLFPWGNRLGPARIISMPMDYELATNLFITARRALDPSSITQSEPDREEEGVDD